MIPTDSDDGESDDGQNLPIFSELISDKFTVDNLRELSSIVKSSVMLMQMIEWSCKATRFEDTRSIDDHQITLLEYAVMTDNTSLFQFMIKLGSEQQALLAEEMDDQKSYIMSRRVFEKAIKLGRTEMLSYMIKTTGVDIPLNELIQESGFALVTKPRYYQGLTIGGKKRADWAKAPNSHVQIMEERISPVLQTARVGSVESVDWFMSDAPVRNYKEFAGVHWHDKRIRSLERSSGVSICFPSFSISWLASPAIANFEL